MAFGTAIAKESALHNLTNTKKSWWKDPGLRRLNFWCQVLMIGSFVCGYDGSVMNGFWSIASFLQDTDNPDANLQGLFSAGISVGYCIAFFPASWCGDRFGRKWPQVFGGVVVFAGVLMQAFAIGPWKFFGSRILVGVGGAFSIVLGPAHLLELAYPSQASLYATLFGACWYVGAIVAAWLTFGCLYIESNWSWRLPSIVQGVPSIIQAIMLIWVPESPRYLMSIGKVEEAKAILVEYHANGDPNDELVLHEIAQITEGLKMDSSSSYMDFLKTPGNRKRLFITSFLGLMIQWAGNGIISYYLSPILVTVGITSPQAQQGINGGLQIWNFICALAATFYSDKLGRRFLWLTSTGGMLISYSIITATSAVYASSGSPSVGAATIFGIFLYNAFYSFSYTIFSFTYSVEIVPFNLRSKAMAITNFTGYAALFFNQYANPIAFNAIGWKYFTVYIVVLAVFLVIIYFTFPETAGLSVEEAALVCDAPAKARLQDAAEEEFRRIKAAKTQHAESLDEKKPSSDGAEAQAIPVLEV